MLLLTLTQARLAMEEAGPIRVFRSKIWPLYSSFLWRLLVGQKLNFP